MLLKWIQCEVEADHRQAFNRAQTGWAPIREMEGFLGQCGGWQARDQDSSSACILGLWRSPQHHEDFLTTGPHDAIMARNGQGETMRSWRTLLFSTLFAMPGDFPDLVQALEKAPVDAFLRVADCAVSTERSMAFRTAQEQIWLPAMRDSEGMLGGLFSLEEPDRFLVATLWKSEAHHQAYVEGILPGCRERVAAMGGEPDRLTGAAFPLESQWTIPRARANG